MDGPTVIPPERATAAENEAAPSLEAKDGDVYRFSYSQESWERAKTRMGGGDLNWCFDGQLICRDGLLCDTYWGLSWGGDGGRYFTVAEALAAGTLEFVCNINDTEKIREDELQLYAEGDAFNLSHQHGCYRYFVKRTGVRKDKDRLRTAVHQKVHAAREAVAAAVRNLEYTIERREHLLPLIEAGEEKWL